MTDEDLAGLFTEFGTVTSGKILKDKMNGRSKGFGFVEMEDDEAAKAAIAAYPAITPIVPNAYACRSIPRNVFPMNNVWRRSAYFVSVASSAPPPRTNPMYVPDTSEYVEGFPVTAIDEPFMCSHI